MAVLNITDASRAVGVSRATMHRKVKAGELSTVRQPDGSRGIDTTELVRVFGEFQSDGKGGGARDTRTRAAHDAPGYAVMAVELDMLRERIAELQQRVTELQGERDQAREQARAALSREQVAVEREREAAERERLLLSRLTGPSRGMVSRLVDAVQRLRGRPGQGQG